MTVVKIILNGFILLVLANLALAQAPDTMWVRTFDNSEWEDLNWVEETFNLCSTSGGGFIACGTSRPLSYGNWDALLVLTEPNGDLVWSKTFDFSSTDCGNCVKSVGSGGFIFCGMTVRSNGVDGNVLVVRTDDLGDTIHV